MQYQALACDGDGTLLRTDAPGQKTVQALMRWKRSGRRLILVTGESLKDAAAFPNVDLFDRVVAENGAVLYDPAMQKHHLLTAPPPVAFVRALRKQQVKPLKLGRIIVSTKRPHDRTIAACIQELALDWQILFNRQDVMALPNGVDKASGLAAALAELRLSAPDVVGVGDAENDCALLAACGCGVAVANALPELKKCADIVTKGGPGRGVQEIIQKLLGRERLTA